MSETNFDWDDLRLFLAVARGGGLAAAAQITEKSAPTLGRRMLALESRIGQDLFKRLPRGYTLTDQGQKLLETATTLEDSISPLIRPGAGSIRRIKISAGTWVTHYLSRHVASLNSDPSVVLQFISANETLDIAHREAVIGIRNRRPTQISLAGRHTSKIRFAVYAVDDAVDCWACGLSPTPSAQWMRSQINDERCIEVNDPRSALDMVIAGAAKTVLPTFIGENVSGISRISDDIEELEHMQWLVTHHEERHKPEVRQVLDRLYARLTSH